MVRTQVSLTEAQTEQLRELAEARATSVTALVRDAVERTLADVGSDERKRQARAVVGSFSSGRADTSETHDRHLGRAYQERSPR